MKLALIGATGRTGLLVLEQALDRGHEVRAFARAASKLGEHASQVEVVEGDVLDQASVSTVVNGVDAVVSCLGRTRATSGDMMGPAARSIVAAMREHGVARLVATTGAGVRSDDDDPKLVDRAIVGLMKLVARDALRDGEAFADEIRASGLDWTLARAPRLHDGPGGRDLYVGIVGPDSGTKLNRTDFARFVLDQLEDDESIRSMPMASER
jgi:putative NADH-flavin reductase